MAAHLVFIGHPTMEVVVGSIAVGVLMKKTGQHGQQEVDKHQQYLRQLLLQQNRTASHTSRPTLSPRY